MVENLYMGAIERRSVTSSYHGIAKFLDDNNRAEIKQ